MVREPYLRTEFTVTAHVKQRRTGQTTIFKDIVSVSATFALNTIPTCTLQLATGFEVRDGTPATIHEAVSKLEPRDRVVVKLVIDRDEQDGRVDDPVVVGGLKKGAYIIFDGFYAGMGYQRSNNHATATMHLVHWIDDLNCSSILNGDWSPGTPSDLAQAASISALSEMSGGATPAANRSGDGALAINVIDKFRDGNGNIIGPQNMEEALWEKVIKEIFLRLAVLRTPLLQSGEPEKSEPVDPPDGLDGLNPEPGWEPKNANNEAAIGALGRMPGKAAQLPQKYQAKLPLNLTGLTGGDTGVMVGMCAHDGLCSVITNGIGHNTFWSVLVGELAPQFMFAVSPGVEFAQVVPFFPGLYTEHVAVTGEEYNYANFNANCATMLNQIVMYYPSQNNSGSGMGGRVSPIHSYNNPVGFYPEHSKTDHHWGTKLVRHPPAWLRNVSPSPAWVRDTTMHTPAGSTTDPGKGNQQNAELPEIRPENAINILDREKDEVDGSSLNIFSRFACHWYKSAILGQRYGELSGKLRFDIAPGSIIKVLPASTAIGEEKQAMFGAVVQVSFTIDAEQHTAGTSFSLSHIRTEEENDFQKEVNKTHFVGSVAPLYHRRDGSPWSGGPLVMGQEPDV